MICNCRYCNGDVDQEMSEMGWTTGDEPSKDYQSGFKFGLRQGKESIKNATPEELMANEHVQFLLDHISGIYTLAMDHKKRNHSIQLLCKEALEKFEGER